MSLKKIKIDLTKLEPIDTLDSEEKMFHAALQKGHFEFDHSEKTKKHYADVIKNSAKQRKAISLIPIPLQNYIIWLPFLSQLKSSSVQQRALLCLTPENFI